jgi:hypothetical protein
VIRRAALLCCLLVTAEAAAQGLPGGRTSIEAVAAVASTSDLPDDPFVWLDLAATVGLNDSIDIIVRPYARRLPGGDWDALLYQAEVRFQPATGVRIDAGIITSPFGLGPLELRPDLNPVVSYPFYYFGQIQPFDQSANSLQIISGGYPLGAVVSWSGSRWDGRAAVTDSTPARGRDALRGGPASTPQFIAGGGFTPFTGFRVGAGLATGKYRKADDDDYFPQPGGRRDLTDATATLVNLEAEYAVRHTKISGEWVRDRFDSDTGAAVARAFYVQAVQTLTPRIFAAGRFARASTPSIVPATAPRVVRMVGEATAGYRLCPELTFKAGYQASRGYGQTAWNHTAIWSIVWAQRWF